MWRFYHPLWEASEKARYLAGGAFTLDASAVEHYLRKRHHAAIEKWATNHLPPAPHDGTPAS
jgi:hypothetical protein